MKPHRLTIYCLIAGSVFAGSVRARAQGSATGSLQFEAQATPSGSQAEPVRQLPFYLLRKELADIRKEAEQTYPPADMDHFIESLKVSSKLKDWMKKNHSVELSGVDFTRRIKADDIMGVPEFLEAYKNLNSTALPTSKANESDKQKNPRKYQNATEQYETALRQYIEANPHTIDGLDAELSETNPSPGWRQLQADQKAHAEQRALVLAQTEYLAAKTTSDLSGRGEFSELAPGPYWITTLNVPALAGDARLLWDLPVTIRAGETARIGLSNLNALPQPTHMAQ